METLNSTVGVGPSPPEETQTMREHFEQCEKNCRQQLVGIIASREAAAQLHLLDVKVATVRKILYCDFPF